MAKILLADDNQANRSYLEKILIDEGHQIEVVKDGAELVARLRAAVPDLMIAGVPLPVMDGLQAVAEIRRDETLRHLPVIFMFATHGDAVQNLKGLEATGSDYLIQPVDRAELAFRVKANLRVKALYDQSVQSGSSLAESEQRWQFALEGSQDGVWDWNAVTNEVFYSRRWKEMLGYAEDEIGDQLDEWDKRVHPDDKARCYADLERHLRGESPAYENEHRLLCKDGSYKWILDRGKIIAWTADRKPLRVIGTHADITEIKQAQELLAERERTLSSILRAAPIGIGLVIDRVFREVNDTFCTLTGYTREELLGHSARMIYPDDEEFKRVGREKYSAIETTGSGSIEARVRRKDGKVIDVLFSSTLLDRDDPAAGATFTALDITERKRAEATLQQRETHLRTLIDNLPDLVWLKDPNGVYINCNRRFERFFGAKESAIAGKTDYDFVDKKLADSFRQNDEAAMAARTPTVNEEEVTYADDGHKEMLETIKVPMYEVSGKLVGVLGIARDITERMRAEKALRESEDQFRSVVQDLPALVCRNRLDGTILFVNDAYCEYFNKTREALIGQNFFTSIPENERALVQANFSQLSAEQPFMVHEHQVIAADGSIRYQRWSNRAICDDKGEVILIQAYGEDVTERKQAAEALRESEAKYRSFLEAQPDLMFLLSDEGVHLDFYAPSMDRLYVDPNDFLGKRVDEVLSAEASKKFTHSIRELLKTSQLQEFEYQLDFPDGTRYYDCRMAISGENRVLAIVREISERKQHEAFTAFQARRAEALLELPRAAEELDETAFIQRGLELAEELTSSKISFSHFVNDDETIELVTWSRRTLQDYCRAAYDKHYPVREAGIWADALRQAKPVVFNDYPGYGQKQGLPEGHAELQRLISLPVIEQGKVAMLAGVGNKDTDYTDLDVETLQLIANEIWRIVQRHRGRAALVSSAAHYRELVDNMSDGVAVYQAIEDGRDFVLQEHNRAGVWITGIPRDQIIGRRVTEVFPGVTKIGLLDVLRRVWETGRPEVLPARQYRDERISLWIENYVFKLPSGNIVAVYKDITDEKKVAEELTTQLDELRRWHDVTLDREGRILELKHEVNTLLTDLERPPRYRSAEGNGEQGAE